ncbi:MAG: hypothetical protein OEM28_03960 [Nitrosopumilus sp.]|nr:hypothetical protein [Nitrosopumilus sp.]MDH3487606.1 hypothetical protein [Nitrosopumilus sp.]
MPHIVFGERIDLDDFSEKFAEIFQRDPILIKVTNIFVDKEKLTALLPAVVRSEKHQQFLIEISTRKSKTTIRLYPNTDPEKTDGVKFSMALLAEQIMSHYPNFQIIQTNLSNYLSMVIKN